MTLLGGTVGLALLYLLLSAAETPGSGAKALPGILSSITAFMDRLIGKGDILGGMGTVGGVVPGAQPTRVLAPRSEVNRVLAESGRYPGEIGRGGEGATLGNPGAELMPTPGAAEIQPPRRRLRHPQAHVHR